MAAVELEAGSIPRKRPVCRIEAPIASCCTIWAVIGSAGTIITLAQLLSVLYTDSELTAREHRTVCMRPRASSFLPVAMAYSGYKAPPFLLLRPPPPPPPARGATIASSLRCRVSLPSPASKACKPAANPSLPACIAQMPMFGWPGKCLHLGACQCMVPQKLAEELLSL